MLVHSHPFAHVLRFERELDRLFDRPFGVSRAAAGAPLAVLPDADGVTVRAELPGVDPAAIQVNVENRVLTIGAERPVVQRQGGRTLLQERTTGAFTHTLRLADELDAEAISASAEHGVLTLRIPKRAEARPRKVNVQVS